VTFDLDRSRVRDLLSGLLMQDAGALSEAASKALLEAYGIPVTRPLAADSAEEAIEAATRIGYPVVLKVRSPDVVHKTDVGGVETDVRDAAGVRAAFERIASSTALAAPGARVDGATVQPMLSGPGHELVVGARKDPTFGAVIMVGAGGIATELLGDSRLALPPLNEPLARRMLEPLEDPVSFADVGLDRRRLD
jgi:acetyltransferase